MRKVEGKSLSRSASIENQINFVLNTIGISALAFEVHMYVSDKDFDYKFMLGGWQF